MTVVTSDSSVILGVSHLLVGGELTLLLKCPYCNFRNIHEDMITHHITFTDDSQHKDVGIEQLGKSRYTVTRVTTKESPYGPNLSKAELKLHWIKCLWCNYSDKIKFDLSLHMLEHHKRKLLQLQISHRDHPRIKQTDPFARLYGRLEHRLEIAVEIAKRRTQVDCAIDTVRENY
jgi:hypothetical protein